MVLNNDNDESRQVLESCYRHRKTVLNPIINWTDADVWEFIKTYNVPYCKLYDEGFARLGCIGCPMGGGKRQLAEFERWPKYKGHYLRAFGKMLERKGHADDWKTPEDVFDWWVGNTKAPKPLPGQLEMKIW